MNPRRIAQVFEACGFSPPPRKRAIALERLIPNLRLWSCFRYSEVAHFFGSTLEFWLNLQSLFEIRLAKRRSGRSIRALPRLKRLERVSTHK